MARVMRFNPSLEIGEEVDDPAASVAILGTRDLSFIRIKRYSILIINARKSENDSNRVGFYGSILAP